MLEGPRSRWGAIGSRLRRLERRELRAWLEKTRNLIGERNGVRDRR